MTMPRRRSRGRLTDYLLAIAFLAAAAVLASYLAKRNEVSNTGTVHVLDGDSFRLGTREIRLQGIDAPEGRQWCGEEGDTWPCGIEARKFLRQITKKQQVTCKGSETDKYDRMLAVCSVAGMEINSHIVSEGWAVAFGDYETEEAAARANKRGIWRSSFVKPQEWRRTANDNGSGSEQKGILDILFGEGN